LDFHAVQSDLYGVQFDLYGVQFDFYALYLPHRTRALAATALPVHRRQLL
jgi:hypothetical protein